MTPKWAHKYERKPGRWIFEPTTDYRKIGEDVLETVNSVWKAPHYYYHLRKGGHVRALAKHTQNTFFIRFDIEDFFARINRGRVTRCLKQFFPFPYASQMAEDSTVRHPTDKDRQVIPYGFVQSPILASLALAKSRLGTVLNVLNKSKDMNVSVYVDDIIVSGNDAAGLEGARDVLVAAATRSGLAFNAAKTQGPARLITAFNVKLTHKSLAVVEERMQKFALDLAAASEESRQGILSYVQSVNSDQALGLAL